MNKNTVNYILRQDDSYIEIVLDIDWNTLGRNKSDYAFIVVYRQQGETTYRTARRQDFLAFNAEDKKTYDVWVYGVWLQSKATSIVVDNIYYYDDKFWLCMVNGTTVVPAENIPEWKVLSDDENDLIYLDTGSVSQLYKMYGAYAKTPCNSGDIVIEKIDDHKWNAKWVGSGTATEYKFVDYKNNVIDSGIPDANEVFLETPFDGLYVIYFTVDEKDYFKYIYDLTDAEECYKTLMREILCECDDCKDCNDKTFTRALNFAVIFQMIMELSHSGEYNNESIDSIFDDNYTETVGLLFRKLMIMTDNCTCDE